MVNGKIAVGLITYNRPRTAAHTLQSLLSQTRLPDAIVVYDNSPGCHRIHDTPEFASLLSWSAEIGVAVDLITRTPSGGMVGAREAAEGFCEALHAPAAFLVADDDVVFVPTFVEVLARNLAKYDVAGGHVVSMRSTEPVTPLRDHEPALRRSGFYSGGTFAYRRQFMGMWGDVAAVTTSLGEDVVWQTLAHGKGARFAPATLCPPTSLHLDLYSPAKYGGQSARDLIYRAVGEARPVPTGGPCE